MYISLTNYFIDINFSEKTQHVFNPNTNKQHLKDTMLHRFIERNNFPTAPVVYSDGCCLNNGNHLAVGGVGVYWGPNHPKYFHVLFFCFFFVIIFCLPNFCVYFHEYCVVKDELYIL